MNENERAMSVSTIAVEWLAETEWRQSWDGLSKVVDKRRVQV